MFPNRVASDVLINIDYFKALHRDSESWRRYGMNVEYKRYPFGALRLHPQQPVTKVKEPKHNKWHDRHVPAVLVEIALGLVISPRLRDERSTRKL